MQTCDSVVSNLELSLFFCKTSGLHFNLTVRPAGNGIAFYIILYNDYIYKAIPLPAGQPDSLIPTVLMRTMRVILLTKNDVLLIMTWKYVRL